MKLEQVSQMSSLARFLYWIRERHNIYLKRKAGVPKPWTDDEVLQNYFFTNPYRENDRVTVWFRKTVRNPLRNDARVLFATICFRWFNYIPTGRYLLGIKPTDNKLKLPYGGLEEWDQDVKDLLVASRDSGNQMFTGAYMINSPGGKRKLEAIMERIDNVWNDKADLIIWFTRNPSRSWKLQEAHKRLTQYPGLGGFMAYEVVCDLRYTIFLRHASDVDTWCNPGPGCIRGLYRIAEEPIPNLGNNATSPPRPDDWKERMVELLKIVRLKHSKMPHFEMREIEHSLCEFDKYERARLGDGKLKRKYKGS